ncbi:THUMP domain protein [Talaromyces stipitatus ATCC 10500]|uniref:THUMP domain protein n=1 Tax=Talaromyces stipitatus (strain ATCC 10500 / CBS 375.48 / QM 6759 / NRRL 1006) TaxID=441959 RepID=B8M5L9_TALSN|nr:THUMP domain protein [Talaromyces stipitatus ATCC 10500]EED19913.1 THUMP domain protein [Talaromyces stipitatus ATCC 10500]
MASRPPNRVSKPKKGGGNYKKSKGGPAYKVAFESGDAGVFITCDMGREGKCAGEILDIFTEYYEKSLGKQNLSGATGQNIESEDDNEDDSDAGDDIEAQIRKEVEGLKPKASKPRLFQKVTANMPCMVFYRVDKSIDPVKLVHDICEEAKANPEERKTRWIKRMTPITQIRKVLSVDLAAFAKEVLEPYFHGDAGPKKFAIRPAVRNNNSFNRDDIIKTVAAAVGPGHKVDLKNPDYTILVEIAQVGISLPRAACA